MLKGREPATFRLHTENDNLIQGSPKYGPRATSDPLRPLIWPAELSLKKQTKLGKLKILTPLYSDMHIAKIHVAVCKALCLICNDTIAVLKESSILGDIMNPSIHRITQ